jgi:hypothetical protein
VNKKTSEPIQFADELKERLADWADKTKPRLKIKRGFARYVWVAAEVNSASPCLASPSTSNGTAKRCNKPGS